MGERIECMIGDCHEAPDRTMVVNESGVLVEYAVCALHERSALAGA
ncbi:hypothetical protein [Subtercola frigoramans]|uniref:Uncharacterized protein n=1 Tax=Subtercola frigoramans TaxID=120298 RepID=A0ABS2L222_9MICO|nr:hypothetical protein [Subtercola frigoramans]MBM7470536.1 hypothetical protein [Subtercola frigoramans]